MGDIANLVCGFGWSWEENKEFELALAMVDEDDPNRWEVVAAMVGGKKTVEEVQKQYVVLAKDLEFIESGFMDGELEVEDDDHHPWIQHHSVMSPPPYWSDEDQHLLVRLEINSRVEV